MLSRDIVQDTIAHLEALHIVVATNRVILDEGTWRNDLRRIPLIEKSSVNPADRHHRRAVESLEVAGEVREL